MYPSEVGVYTASVLMVLEWTFTSCSQRFGTIDIQEFDHLGYVLEIARNPVTTELGTETLSESKEVRMVHCYT